MIARELVYAMTDSHPPSQILDETLDTMEMIFMYKLTHSFTECKT